MLAYLRRASYTANGDAVDSAQRRIKLEDGGVLQIASEAELDLVLLAAGNRLVVLEVYKHHLCAELPLYWTREWLLSSDVVPHSHHVSDESCGACRQPSLGVGHAKGWRVPFECAAAKWIVAACKRSLQHHSPARHNHAATRSLQHYSPARNNHAAIKFRKCLCDGSQRLAGRYRDVVWVKFFGVLLPLNSSALSIH